MPILLLYLFGKGPLWLRALTLTCFTAIVLFGCLHAATIFRNATERPAHVHHTHKQPARLVRR